MRKAIVLKGQGTGKNARKRKVRAMVASMERSAIHGHAVCMAGIVSKRHAQAHELSTRYKWLGAGLRDGCHHATRTFIPAGKLAARPMPFLAFQREHKVSGK